MSNVDEARKAEDLSAVRYPIASAETFQKLCNVQADIIKGYEEQEAAMVACLTDIAFECDGREDIDNNGGPNFAMRVMNHVRAALDKAGVALD